MSKYPERIVKDNLYLKVVEYDKSMGEHGMRGEIIERLKGKSLEDQIEYFGVIEETSISKYSYGDLDGSRAFELSKSLWESSDIHGIIVDNGVIVGLLSVIWDNSEGPLFYGKTNCTYSVIDEDGTGRDEREDYVRFIVKE